MSDSIIDLERENEEIRLSKLKPQWLANELRIAADRVNCMINDLEKLGYTVEKVNNQYKVFKEI